jgi:hypothetical protein
MTVAWQWPPTFLDGAVVIAIFGSLAKLSDLILDSHQQAQFQRFMDRLTERLIDLNVIKWYPRLRESRIVGVEWIIIARLGRNPKLTESLKTLHCRWMAALRYIGVFPVSYIPRDSELVGPASTSMGILCVNPDFRYIGSPIYNSFNVRAEIAGSTKRYPNESSESFIKIIFHLRESGCPCRHRW